MLTLWIVIGCLFMTGIGIRFTYKVLGLTLQRPPPCSSSWSSSSASTPPRQDSSSCSSYTEDSQDNGSREGPQ